MDRYAFFLAYTLILFCIVSAVVNIEKRGIVIDTATRSWISEDDLKIMIKESLHDAKCSNIFISGESDGIVKLFNDFVKIYRYEYTVNSSVNECTGFLMIFTTVERLVAAMPRIPTASATTEIFVIIDDYVEESTGLFDIPMYENAQVNVVARNGLWILSESYLYPRLFKKVSRPQHMARNHGIVNLQGQELQIASLYLPPYSYLRTTVNRTVAGIEGQFFKFANKDNENKEFDGVEVKLFMLIAEKLNFTWSIRTPVDGSRYGRPNGSDWIGGLIGQIFHKEVDMAFGCIGLGLETYLFSTLTNPWKLFKVQFSVPRPKPHASYWALTKPLSPELWAAFLATLIIQSIYVYVSARINPRISKRFRSFTMTWTEMMGRLLGTYAPTKMPGFELQFQLWHILGVLMVTAYSSSLAAKLANRGYEERIDTVRQFMERNLTWGVEFAAPKWHYYGNMDDPYQSQLPGRFELETGEADRHRKILYGNYAPVGVVLGEAFFPENYVRFEDFKGYRLMKENTGGFYSSFAVQPWLLDSVDMVMLWLHQSGLVNYHLNDVLHRRTPSQLREILMEYDLNEEKPKVLELIPLTIAFCLFVAGLTISTVVFYFELRSARGSRSIRQVLRDIENNRRIRRANELKIKRRYLAFRNCNRESYDFVRSWKNK